MKPTVFLISFVLPLFCFSQYTYKNLQPNFLDNNAAAYTYGNLRLYPVYAKESFTANFKNLGTYMPLQEAVQKKKVKITEKTSGGSVNNLTIENLSSDTIIVICGDVVKGGKQDRIIQEDVLLQPKSGKRDLKVFCVESGRWTASNGAAGSTMNYTVNSQSSAAASVAPEEFKGYFNKGSMSLRKVVEVDKDQSKVWAKVEDINKANKTETATSTYTAITTSAGFTKKLAAYTQFFSNKFKSEQNVIGVIVVTGNKVLGCDLFATPALFSSQFNSLLHSYATEAIVNGKPVTATTAVVKTYMDKLLNDEATQKITLKQKGSAFVEKGKKLRVSSFD
jgi:hypothetical protein